MAAESELEIHQIRYFVETAKTGSMSQAAKNLYVSQQALSKGVANLEEALGAELFVRTKSGVSLTAFGQFFLARAKLVLSSVEFAGNSLRDFSTGTRRTIALGMPSECTTDFGGTLSPTKLYALQQTSPNVTFEFVELRIAEIQKRLDNGTLQFGISGEYDEKRYDNVLLDVFPMTVLVSKDNPLANEPHVSLADLARGRLAIPAGGEDLIRRLERLDQESSVELRTLPMHINPVDGAELIVDDDVFAIRPEQHARRTTSLDRVALVPLADRAGNQTSVSLRLIWRKTLKLGSAEHDLIDYIVELYQNR